jgi:Ca-activated chloride channel homolog
MLSLICATTGFLATTGFYLSSLDSDSSVVEAAASNSTGNSTRKITQGALQTIGRDGQPQGECPLKHTDVKAEVSGSLARVTVTQEFHNPFPEKIEAVYVFPLPQSAAVDDMTMIVGDRTVKGKIKPREEAQAIYEAARAAGQAASLLDQERPNIFTQSVANIAPGAEVKITISYVEFLKYEDGTYEFVFPMVVGPRYIPGRPIAGQMRGEGRGFALNTTRVPDASRVTPRPPAKGMRAGHDIAIEVKLDAGVPIDGLKSTLHEVDVNRPDDHRALVRLKDQAVIPNKDFILKFEVAGKKISDAIMTHRDARGGYFALMLQPPERVTAVDVVPKELVFVLDTSGSMEGFPIEKAKETMKLALDNLYPDDTFNLITFSGDTHVLFPQPVSATPENLRKAREFLASRQGSGGTEMMEAIHTALAPSDEQDHVRIVCFMTDGYVGNDMEIISKVQKHPNARIFAFGIGESVNRFLLDKMAEYGRGEVEYVTLGDDGSAAARRFHERVRNPLLTDIAIDWAGLPVADVYPKRLPDLFSAKPLILTGRYTASARGVIRLSGNLAGQHFVKEIPIELPETQNEHDVLATLWARTRIDDLMSQDYEGIQNGDTLTEVREAITNLGLEYRLVTQFTSFVAVEETIVTEGGQPLRIDVPIEVPEGVSREGIFGQESTDIGMRPQKKGQQQAQLISGVPGGVPGGMVSGIKPGSAVSAPTKIPNISPTNVPESAGKMPVIVPSTPPPPIALPKVSSGVLQGTAIKKVLPAYPEIARAARMSGSVQVQVTVNESGDVIDAQVISGHALLSSSALQAAKQWKFIPTSHSGKPVKVQGVFSFNFVLENNAPVEATVPPIPLTLLTEDRHKQILRAKLHPAVAAVIERLNRKDAKPGANEAKFTADGKAAIQVWLTEKTAETVEQLQKLGLAVVSNPQSSRLIIGRLPIEKLSALAELPAVKYIAPQY